MRFERLMEHLVGAIALLVLVSAALFVIAPFITSLLWGAILAYCTWQPFHLLAKGFGGRRAPAALLVVFAILVLLIVPIGYAGMALATRAPDLVDMAQQRLAAGIPPLPQWLTQIPLAGPRVQEAWDAILTRNPEMVQRLRELAAPALLMTLGAGLSVVKGLGLLVLSVLFAAFFYLSGEGIGAALEAGMGRIAGARAGYLLGLIGATVKGVVYGILGTALVQAVLCALGYWVVGLPSPALLGLATFFLAIIPAGPMLIIVPGAIWLVQQGAVTWAVVLVVWTLVVGIAIDNVLKPMIIGKSSHVPFILIMLGVLGGAAAFGLLGVFVGPTVLAVAHVVLRDWAVPAVEAKAAAQSAATVAAPPRQMGARFPGRRAGDHREQPS